MDCPDSAQISTQIDGNRYENPKFDRYGQTKAMIQAANRKIPEERYIHKPEIQNQHGETVAMLLAANGIISPEIWQHDPNIKNQKGETVADILQRKQLPVSNKWYDEKMKDEQKNPKEIEQAIYGIVPTKQVKNQDLSSDEQNCHGFTVAMCLVINQIDVPKEWQHNQILKNKYNQTVAMIIMKQNREIPQHWMYDPEYTINEEEQTTAMILAKQGIIPSKLWQHKPEIQDINGNTVAMLLAQNGIVAPKEWQHDKEMENNDGQKVEQMLIRHNYIFQDGDFIPNVQVEQREANCNICMKNKQEIIKTTCGHTICLDCYKDITKRNRKAPCCLCRKQQWFVPIDQQQYEKFMQEE